AEDGIRDATVTGVQTCALPISDPRQGPRRTERPGAARELDSRLPGIPGEGTAPRRGPHAAGVPGLAPRGVEEAPRRVRGHREPQIGRASCRERVRRRVWERAWE